ncbi:FAD-dependent oxidoreductase [Acuticoccus sediminis]|uniref:FAD-dependent oxidoreductase n=1 Tax=Acuticoccus sediminis TaxID=2184697 RepID=A0A8B2NXL9_9HYPH|nr:FAD-binding oxidoreductase [Acuticoccus sediminis]RAI02284.1 FAD-dependent oxidoreductase [Acuticoccus sediminis]
MIAEMLNPTMPPSLWAETARERFDAPPPDGDLDVDVAVVGSGFTGLSTALHLAGEGTRVVSVDAAMPGWGASGRNGGQVIPGLKDDPDALEAHFGAAVGGRMAETAGAAPSLVFSLVDEHGIDCDVQRAGWIQPAHCRTALRLVQDRCAQWRRRGADVEPLDAEAVAELLGSRPGAYLGGWLDRRGGAVQPLAYARGLARAAAGRGARIHGGSRVVALERDGTRWRLRLATGASIIADHVVLATNGYTDDLWPGLKRTVVPVYSFQTASEPLSPNARASIFPKDHVASDTRRLLWYFRLTREGRLVMGGRGPYSEVPGEAAARMALANLENLFPEIGPLTPAYAWAGRVAMTKDHFPHLHRLADGVWAGLGFNGRGVAMGTMMGRCLAEAILGREPGLPVMDPLPFRLHAFRRFGISAYSALYRRRDARESANPAL